jgi:hypothetical protein
MSDLKAWDVLRLYQKQCDMDGIEVQVSRQALDETLDALEAKDRRIAEYEEIESGVVAELIADNNRFRNSEPALKRRASEYMRENERLRAALVRYGAHTDDCRVSYRCGKRVKPCSCGFDEALAAIE